MTSGLARFGRPTALVCNLGTSGSLPAHQPGVAYSGTFNVTNRVGEVTAELVSATPALPAGWSLQVNQATGVVTLAWPAAAPVSAPPLPNLDFEAGAANWLLGNAWIIDGAGLQDGGTQAGRYRGAGQSSLRHAQAVPVTPGTTITASARISKGTTRADFAGGAVVLEWLTAAGAPLDFSVGNVVNTGTAAFQTSTVTATAPAGAGLVRLAVSATRDIKGRASDSVYVDNVTWNHTYTLPGGVNTDYAVVIRVRDGRGCQATLSQTVEQGAPVLTILDSTYTQLTAITTSHLVNYPATVNAGDLLVMVVGARASGSTFTGAISSVAGWVQTSNDAPAATPNFRAATFYRIATGTEGGTTVDVPTTVGLAMIAVMYRIPAGSYSGVPVVATSVLGSPGGHMGPPRVSSGAGAGVQSLYIAGGVLGTGTVINPVSYDAVGAFNTNTTYNSAPIIGIASYGVLNSDGTFGDNEVVRIVFPSNVLFVAFTIGIRPA